MLFDRRFTGRLAPVQRLALGALAVALAGCAPVATRASFPDVTGLAVQRGLEQHVAWRDGSGAELDAAADALLAQPLDAEAAVQVALLRNPSLQASYEELGIAQADLLQAGLLRNPVLSASAMPAVGAAASPKYEFNVAQSLLDLLLVPSRGRIAGAQLEETKLRVAGDVVALAADVRAAWFAVAGARQLSEVLEVVAHAADASATFADSLHEAGNLSELDLASERALGSQAHSELLRARVDEIVPHEHLARLMGVAGTGSFTIVDGLPPLPARDPDAAEMLDLAARQRLELAAARQEQMVLREGLETARAWRWFGDVEVGAGASKESGESYFVVGPSASLELPLFDQKQAQLAGLEAKLRRSELHADAIALDVASEVRTAVATLHAQRDLAAHQRGALVPLRERIVALSQQQYDYMQIGTFELLLAKQAEVLAYRDYLAAVRDYWLAFAALERAVGARVQVGSAADVAPPLEMPAPTPPPIAGDGAAPLGDAAHHHHHGGQ